MCPTIQFGYISQSHSSYDNQLIIRRLKQQWCPSRDRHQSVIEILVQCTTGNFSSGENVSYFMRLLLPDQKASILSAIFCRACLDSITIPLYSLFFGHFWSRMTEGVLYALILLYLKMIDPVELWRKFTTAYLGPIESEKSSIVLSTNVRHERVTLFAVRRRCVGIVSPPTNVTKHLKRFDHLAKRQEAHTQIQAENTSDVRQQVDEGVGRAFEDNIGRCFFGNDLKLCYVLSNHFSQRSIVV